MSSCRPQLRCPTVAASPRCQSISLADAARKPKGDTHFRYFLKLDSGSTFQKHCLGNSSSPDSQEHMLPFPTAISEYHTSLPLPPHSLLRSSVHWLLGRQHSRNSPQSLLHVLFPPPSPPPQPPPLLQRSNADGGSSESAEDAELSSEEQLDESSIAPTRLPSGMLTACPMMIETSGSGMAAGSSDIAPVWPHACASEPYVILIMSMLSPIAALQALAALNTRSTVATRSKAALKHVTQSATSRGGTCAMCGTAAPTASHSLPSPTLAVCVRISSGFRQ